MTIESRLLLPLKKCTAPSPVFALVSQSQTDPSFVPAATHRPSVEMSTLPTPTFGDANFVLRLSLVVP